MPNHQRWYAKMEAQSEYVHISYMFFLHAQSVLNNKISASELSWKLIWSALLVGVQEGIHESQKFPEMSSEEMFTHS